MQRAEDGSGVFRVERHELGPRLYVLGRRVHECHAGAVLLFAMAALRIAGLHLPLPLIGLVLALGSWFLGKDWHDLFPHMRDTTAWSVSVHRAPRPLRPRRRAEWLAPVAGICATGMGLVNVASAATPSLHSRMQILLQLVPREVPVAAHALALSAGISLAILGFYLVRRRRRAWALAVAVLAIAGVLNMLKGLDVEEALASWALAAGLVWGREAFYVQHDGVPLWRVLGLGIAATCGMVWAHDGLDLLWMGAALNVGWLLFRPLAAPRGMPGGELRPLAREIVQQHGRDTLSFFKLRADKHHFFDSTRRAFVGYRIEGGVLLVSGDPIGPPDALPGLVSELCGFAEVRGLAIGVVGASEEFAALAAGAGLRSFYIGDEAIVELAAFSLDGRPIRKVRQAVTRARKAGFGASLLRMGDLDEAQLAELEELSERWRGDEPERGFSMAIDSLRGEHLDESLVVVARDADGHARGFIHFAPCYGRPAVSLGLMRRDRDSVNGLMEYLVVSSIELLRERGIEEMSLNFAAFARLLHSPSNLAERALGRIVTLANPYFQIESLYRFNAKFSPRWQPRYLLYERRPLGFTRTGLAAMWAEGQLPRPSLRLAR
jgi:lysyl-tRNA synthetase class 2